MPRFGVIASDAKVVFPLPFGPWITTRSNPAKFRTTWAPRCSVADVSSRSIRSKAASCGIDLAASLFEQCLQKIASCDSRRAARVDEFAWAGR
ncbi:MAG: hypothetical protein EBX36_04660 [Planctomycetia bacterium]|nr:hypothetical protein [Planctomycetia bacterium]